LTSLPTFTIQISCARYSAATASASGAIDKCRERLKVEELCLREARRLQSMFVFCKAGYGVKTRLGGASPQPAADAPPAFDYVTLKTIGGNENDRGERKRSGEDR